VRRLRDLRIVTSGLSFATPALHRCVLWAADEGILQTLDLMIWVDHLSFGDVRGTRLLLAMVHIYVRLVVNNGRVIQMIVGDILVLGAHLRVRIDLMTATDGLGGTVRIAHNAFTGLHMHLVVGRGLPRLISAFGSVEGRLKFRLLSMLIAGATVSLGTLCPRCFSH